MSKSDAYENGMLNLALNNIAYAGLGDAGGLLGSAADGNTYVALHTADPTDAGNQGSSEIAYTSYARVAVVRTGAAWNVAGGSASPAAAITFPVGTGGAGTATHWSVGHDAAGAGIIIYHGTLTPNVICGNTITPQVTTASTIVET